MHWSILPLTILLLLIGTTLLANEEISRQVIGGDLVYTGKSTAQTQELAIFKAEAEAVHGIIVECGGFPHRDIIIFETHVESDQGQVTAIVEVGLSFQSCEQGRNASQPTKTRLTNPDLARKQKIYEELVIKEMKLPSGKEKELKDLIKDEFSTLRSQIKVLYERMKVIQPTIIQTKVIENQRNPIQNSRDVCLSQYKLLLKLAESAAIGNIPPGNLAQGLALTYYDQAQSILRNCK